MNKIKAIKIEINKLINNITEPFKNHHKKIKIENKAKYIFLVFIRSILLYGLAFVVLFPLLQQISLAVRDPGDINKPTVVFIPEVWSLFNLKLAAVLLDYFNTLKNSLRLSFTVMVLQVLVTALSGYAFAKLRFKGAGLLFLIVIATVLIPPQTLSVSRYLYFMNFDIFGIIKTINGKSLNLLNTRYSLYLMTALGMGINSGLFIYIFRQFFRNIPHELDESAQVDGASVFRTFWSVMLPNARPAMLTVGLFAFVWQYNDIYYVRLLQISNDLELISPRLANALGFLPDALIRFGVLDLIGGDVSKNPYFGALVSNIAALITMLPLLVIFIFLQKYFVEGIERTGIVG